MKDLWQLLDENKMKGKRDRALLSLLLACGLRRKEAVCLRLRDLEQRENHWAIVDLVGKGGHIRTVPIPEWVREQLENWITAAGVEDGKIFRHVDRFGNVWGGGLTVKAVWHIVKQSAKKAGIGNIAPHDLRSYAERRIMPNRNLSFQDVGWPAVISGVSIRHNRGLSNLRSLWSCQHGGSGDVLEAGNQ